MTENHNVGTRWQHLPVSATRRGRCRWSSQWLGAPPGAECSSPWSRTSALSPRWTPPFLHTEKHTIGSFVMLQIYRISYKKIIVNFVFIYNSVKCACFLCYTSIAFNCLRDWLRLDCCVILHNVDTPSVAWADVLLKGLSLFDAHLNLLKIPLNVSSI